PRGLAVFFGGAARARRPENRAAELLDGLDAVTTWGAWHHWRSGGKSPQQARAAMEATVLNLLAAGDQPRG
ncbi:TetR/AcrR family transcriptional regulator, partial [Streptomyces virginiae]